MRTRILPCKYNSTERAKDLIFLFLKQKVSMPGQHNILDGNGEVRRLLKSCDWSKFPLSDPSSWRAPFTTVMQLMLDSGQPACLAWGMELHFFYNDAYMEVLGKNIRQL